MRGEKLIRVRYKRTSAGAGKTAERLRALAVLPETWVQFPAPTWQLTTAL